MRDLEADSLKLVNQFGAKRIEELKALPDHLYFHNGLVYSHRDFDVFYKRLLAGEPSAIVSGLNPSGNLHLGHMAVFGINKFLQERHNLKLYIPISDDESYVAQKIKSQEEGLKNSLSLTKSLLAYGFDPDKTKIVIDQLYTDVYNLAFKLSRGVTLSTIRAVYDYTDSQNIGLHFYPAVQAAHVTLPQLYGMPNVVVPISADEDAHLRVSRDIAGTYGYEKAAVLHVRFLPGTDGKKMSKSKGNGIFLTESPAEIKKKIGSAFSGGRASMEEHRKLGGRPEADISYIYLKYYFLNPTEARELYDAYKGGRVFSGEMKKMLTERVLELTAEFRERYEKVTTKDLEKVVMMNEDVDLKHVLEKVGME